MRIHILGICGTFMGGIARLASSLGNDVFGTDTQFYEPMASQLKNAGIETISGFGDLPPADLHIVGNVIRRGNPSFENILTTGAKFVSGPRWLAREVLGSYDKVITVTGTHGKTTTTAMIVHILERCGQKPGYLIGGEPRSGVPSAELGDGSIFVIEADEYDTAFFDKRPKFTHYWADVCVINNIEFDHADIYRDLEDVTRQFALLPRYLSNDGVMVLNWSDETVRETITKKDWFSISRINDPSGYHWQNSQLYKAEECVGSVQGLPPGDHNRANALAALAACTEVGINAENVLAALADFQLPARRLQIIYDVNRKTVIDDFAHHPSAIKATLATLRDMYPERRLLAALDPWSNTMRAGCWQDQLTDSLEGADQIFILTENCTWDVAKATASLGKKSRLFADVTELEQGLLAIFRDDDALVLLSNRDFAGLRNCLLQSLK